MRPRTLALLALAASVVALVVVVLVVQPFDDEERPDPDDLPPVSAADGVSAGVAPAQADVVVLGDSVTLQSAQEIVAALGGRAVSVIGLSGYRIDELLPTVEDALGGEDRPAVAVVMAGYNDVWQGVEEDAPVDEVVDLMAGVDCAVWVLIPTEGAWDRERGEAFDARVRETAGAAGVHVATAWRDAVDAGAGDTPAAELVAPDLVHPTVAGRQRIAEVMAAAVERSCG
ncbi:SGNH/GDSL hydrolase family protein [Iamia sp. SCSIO 61187]|uniref:SGNH/GDSL hydrolase family protein n=1 Tax=Iamia sp. SCSIO 61187 TaxID=2722752 RepID=UPI001C627105|nr:SGNH/GDSL hydrolase family protein [Iamia sp. SCSIO 61187]QYG93658.1 SGNH/GDSL hydrolase family protein [Iamia sp. SCSIO 61187]